MRASPVLLVTIGLLAMLPAAARAETLTVLNNNDTGPGSLRQTVTMANPGDTVVVPANTYVLGSEIAINKNLTIQGAGAATTTISGNDLSRIFNISDGNVTIESLTLTHGRVNAVNALGGAVLNSGLGSITLQDAAVTESQAISTSYASGAAINSSGSINVIDSTVSDNTATDPGESDAAVVLLASGLDTAARSIVIQNSTFSGNETTGDGYGAAVAFLRFNGTGDLNLTISGSTFTDNRGGTSGGGYGAALMMVPNASGEHVNLAVSDTTFSGNHIGNPTAFGIGGAIDEFTNSGDVTSDLRLDRVTLTGNGGLGTFSQGGAIAYASSSTNDVATLTLTNTTIDGNSAGPADANENGGGVYFSISGTGAHGSVIARNSTITSNSSGAGLGTGGGIEGPATLQNSIVAGNSAAGGTNCSEAVTSLGHNIDDGASCGLTGPGDRVNTDPGLGPLAANGGPLLTRAPSFTSPAVDGGDNSGCPATDARGISRPQGALCDIGALEVAQADLALSNSARRVVKLGNKIAFTLAAHNAGTGTADATTVTDQLPAGLTFASAKPSQGSCTNQRGLVTCALGAVAAGANASVVLSAKTTRAGRVSDSAQTATATLEPLTANNSATASVIVDRAPSVSRFAARRHGKLFTYKLSKAGSVRIRIARALAGRKVGKRCLPATPGRAHRRHCTRLKTVGTLKAKGKRGRNRKTFNGRLNHKPLAAGKYVATIVVRDSLGIASTPRSARFTVG